jgi:hypothetical protein
LGEVLPYLGGGCPYLREGSPYSGGGFPQIGEESPYLGRVSPYCGGPSPYLGGEFPYLGEAFPGEADGIALAAAPAVPRSGTAGVQAPPGPFPRVAQLGRAQMQGLVKVVPSPWPSPRPLSQPPTRPPGEGSDACRKRKLDPCFLPPLPGQGRAGRERGAGGGEGIRSAASQVSSSWGHRL